MAPRAACLLLAAALGLAGCAETRRVVHVGALPATVRATPCDTIALPSALSQALRTSTLPSSRSV